MNAVVEALQNAPAGEDDYTAFLQEVLGTVQDTENPNELFPHAFRFFEERAEADLGMPGPLVHFLERFYPQYVDDLCASVARRPTFYTVWMLNRILNAEVPEPMRERLMALLRNVADSESAGQIVREQARDFLDEQV